MDEQAATCVESDSANQVQSEVRAHRWQGRMLAMVHLVGKLRRQYLTTFRRGYVKRQLAKRQGKCEQCGRCCALSVTCPFLSVKRTCVIYKLWRCASCTTFPIDQRDIRDVAAGGGKCGYYFPEEDGK